MAGRPKQPLSVIQGKGKSNHLTKNVIKEREKQENMVRGNTDNIEAPSYLTKKQQEEFYKIAEELLRLKIFSNLDVDGLARYIDSREMYISLLKEIKKVKATEVIENEKGMKRVIHNESYNKLLRSKNILFNECKAAAGDLGLSITSRLKLVIPQDDKKEEKSEFDKKFGDV